MGIHEGMLKYWQPIETAPRDGTPILGYAGGEYAVVEYAVVEWVQPDNSGYWTLCVCGKYAEDGEWWPTHWMPVPDPPG